jgi:cell division septum initiation protein DivIVA
VSLRGYAREEVDEYLDSLAEALGHVADADEQNRRLQTHINRLNGRIKDLEDQLRDCTPRTGVVLGDRIGAILRQAEEAAADIVRAAESRAAEADGMLGSAVSRGEEEARRLIADARAEAHEIVTEAESRAAARTRQIEQWADQVISHTRAEEARMMREQAEAKAAALADLEALAQRRRDAAALLGSLRDSLGDVIDIVATPRLSDAVPVDIPDPMTHPAASPAVEPEPVVAIAPPDTTSEPATTDAEVIELRVLEPVVEEEPHLEEWLSEGGHGSES